MGLSSLSRFTEVTYALLRSMAGLMFAFHGLQKIFGVYGGHQPPFGSQLWVGGIIELLCGFAVAIGAFTSWAALLASGTMAVAYVQFHWKLEMGTRLLPRINEGELALLYAFVFLFIACRGSGIWSVHRR